MDYIQKKKEIFLSMFAKTFNKIPKQKHGKL